MRKPLQEVHRETPFPYLMKVVYSLMCEYEQDWFLADYEDGRPKSEAGLLLSALAKINPSRRLRT